MESTDIKLDSYLRANTAEIHELTERKLGPLELFTDFKLPNYGIFILIQYYWHLTLESWLKEANPSLLFDGFQYVQKTPLLESDLQELEITPASRLEVKLDSPAIAGIIYVLEGSMLGGAVISKHLKQNGVEARYCNYFSHCADAAPKVWPQARKYLQEIENRDHQFEQILQSSILGFELMIEMTEREIAQSKTKN